jgi:hypothetical protein
MQMKKQNLFELSPAEVMIAPWWVRYILNTGKISFLALLGAIFFTIMAVIGGEGKYSWPMAGLIVCGAWLGLNFLLMHIGFLSYAAKNGDMGYLSRMLLCGPLFWGDYFNKVMKPRLAQSISEKKYPTMGKTKSKKIQTNGAASSSPVSRAASGGLVCDQCGSSKFEFDGYWKEYSCKKCGWVSKE